MAAPTRPPSGTAGRRVWGLANDDSHAATGETGIGWNTVYARERTLPAIIEALRLGRFYASTGVVIRHIGLEMRGDSLVARIDTENAARIIAIGETAKRFAQADALSLELAIPENTRYLRFECWGNGEQFAWSQPLFFTREEE